MTDRQDGAQEVSVLWLFCSGGHADRPVRHHDGRVCDTGGHDVYLENRQR